MPLQEPDPEQTEKTRDHWFAHRCLPFPADGLVPRECTRPAPGFKEEVRRQALEAADLAAGILAADPQALEDLQNPATRLTTLVAHAAVAFASRHGELLSAVPKAPEGRGNARKPGYHPATYLMQAMKELSVSRPGDDRLHGRAWTIGGRWDVAVNEFATRLEHRVSRKATKVKNKKGETVTYVYSDDAANLPHAYRDEAPHGYRCACQENYTPDTLTTSKAGVGPRIGAPRRDEELAPVRTVLQTSGGEWFLLSRLFLAELHGHLGWLPYKQETRSLQPALHQAAGQLLQRRAALPDLDGRLGVALGLAHGLTWQAPKDAAKAVEQLPAVLSDLVPQAPAELARQALRYLGKAAVDTRFFEDHLAATFALARDIACDLTSPVLAAQSGAGQKVWEALRDRMVEVDTKALQALSAEREVRTTGKRQPSLPPPVNASFLRDTLLARKKVISTYFGWMASRGHAIVVDLLNTTHR